MKRIIEIIKIKPNIYKEFLSIFFSFFTIFGYSYSKQNNWDLIFGNKMNLVKSFFIFLLLFIFFRIIIEILFEYLISKIKYKPTENKLLKFIFKKYSFIIPFIIIIFFWIPYVFAYYPGILMQDSREQVKQFYGIEASGATNSVRLIDENVKITNHHPVLHTLVLGGLIKLGGKIVNDNFGVFLYTVMQVIILASSFAYIIKYMNRLKTPYWIRIITLICFAILPFFPFYAVKITKDTIFTALIIFYIIELHKMIKKADYKEKYKILDVTKLIILFLLTALVRNNGIYNIILSFPLLLLIDKNNRKIIVCITFFVFFLYKIYTGLLLPAFKIPNSSIREMLSIPFQQTARFVKENEDKVTEEDKKVIAKVLEYNTLASRYNPVHADSVKNRFNKDATKQDVKNYLKIWLKQFTISPTTYIQATLNNIYGYFYPWCKPVSYIASFSIKYDKTLKKQKVINYYYNKYKKIRTNINIFLDSFEKTPVLNLIISPGFNIWVILIMIAYILYKKKYKYLIIFAPSITLLLVCIASPVNAYFRYSMPNIFAIPLIISIFLDIINENKEEFLDEQKNCSNNTML